MQISQAAWSNYVARLSTLNQQAGQKMAEYIKTHGTSDTKALTQYANALVSKYGEGSAELACQMYEAIAEAEGVRVPAAQPAETADYGEVAKMVQGTKDSPPELQSGVSRLVKRTGADTALKNAIRDGAEFAWVPHGDSCPFCIMLASNGWQRASKKALKNGHAEHIHAHCDCEYAVRFNTKSSVKGYDPDEYWQRYQAAGGDINAMRRESYAANREKINAQKRAAWAARKKAETFEDFRKKYSAANENEILPNYQNVVISDSKIRGYILNTGHPVGGAKAVAFRDVLGYTKENSEKLIAEIMRELPDWKAVPRQITKYGQPYEVKMLLQGTNGRMATVKTGWIIDEGEEAPRLISAYIYKEKG